MLETTPDPRTGKLRHPNTIIGYLSSFRGVFTVAAQQILIDTSPMDKVAVGSKIESKRRPYSVEQVSLIVTRAQAETDDIFLPLLVQAYTGCRVAEIVDCSTPRKIDEWMDGVIKDPNHGGYSIEFGNAEHLAPNDSFRHYLKSELLAEYLRQRPCQSALERYPVRTPEPVG